MVSQDRWSLVAGSVALKCGALCQEYVVLFHMALVSQDRFHCTKKIVLQDSCWCTVVSDSLATIYRVPTPPPLPSLRFGRSTITPANSPLLMACSGILPYKGTLQEQFRIKYMIQWSLRFKTAHSASKIWS